VPCGVVRMEAVAGRDVYPALFEGKSELSILLSIGGGRPKLWVGGVLWTMEAAQVD
jgi:hypothetical protein